MAALDTNVLVRWLTNDDATQCAAVERLMQATSRSGEPLFVPITELLAVEWVLRLRYRFDKAAITTALDALLSIPELEIQNEMAVKVALWLLQPAFRASQPPLPNGIVRFYHPTQPPSHGCRHPEPRCLSRPRLRRLALVALLGRVVVIPPWLASGINARAYAVPHSINESSHPPLDIRRGLFVRGQPVSSDSSGTPQRGIS